MILIDLSQIMVASTMMSMGKDQTEVDINHGSTYGSE